MAGCRPIGSSRSNLVVAEIGGDVSMSFENRDDLQNLADIAEKIT
jgi:hypothetical protein